MTDQIKVTESPVPSALFSLGRQIAVAVGGWAIGRGYLTSDTASAIGTVLVIAAPLLYGQFENWSRHTDLVTLTNQVPDSVSTLK